MEPVIVTVMSTLFIAGVAYGATWKAVKTTLNGTVNDVKEIRNSLRNHINEEANNDKLTHERIAIVETKLDVLSERLK